MTSVVVKVGSSTMTAPSGDIDAGVVDALCAEVVAANALGHRVVVVSSGAIVCGWAALGHPGERPEDPALLQAVSAVGQHRLMRAWQEGLGTRGLLAGQVLLAPLDFGHRRQYLHARTTLTRLLDLGVVPIVNENDAVSDDEIRFGDNDRLSALVAQLVSADLLLLLTDTPGLMSGDPRLFTEVSLVEEVTDIDSALIARAGGPGARGSGGMASKLVAARIASWSGVTTVIADGRRPGALGAALSGERAPGTICRPRAGRMPARKLWIAFAREAVGTLVVDDGARRALAERGASLLPAGVVGVRGSFEPDDPVEISGEDLVPIAKGIVRYRASRAHEWMGRRTSELPEDLSPCAVHRDDLVVLV